MNEKKLSFKSLFQYHRFDQQTFHEILPDMAEANRRYLTILSFILMLTSGVLIIIALALDNLRMNLVPYCCAFTAMAILFFLACFIIKNNPAMIMVCVYLFMIAAIVFSFFITKKDQLTVTYNILLFILPMLFIDMPWRMNLMLFLSSCFCLWWSYQIKSSIVLFGDTVNIISFTFLSIIINTYLMGIKTARLVSEQKNKYLSLHDQLTDFYNRWSFENDLKDFKPLNSGKNVALIALDVNGLKEVNDNMGHGAGDELLVLAAECIKKSYPDPNTCFYRMGGDEFMAVILGTDRGVKDLVDAIEKETACHQSQKFPEFSLSHGIILIPQEECEEKKIRKYVTDADLLMYRNKELYYREKGIDRKYVNSLEANRLFRLDISSEADYVDSALRAVMDGQFVVYYQPQYNHSTGAMIGAEALARWMHPTLGLRSPGEFIPIYEKNGVISNLDLCIFEEVCKFLKKCCDEKIDYVPISVNVSRQDIFNEKYIANMEEIRKKYRIPVDSIHIEITESSAALTNMYVGSFVDKLHDIGYIVEMDDFGSGMSSLNILKDISFDVIKLDMNFVKGDIGDRGGTIISSVVCMCKWLNTPIMAEGVETLEQADYMKSIGCDSIQGYLYSKPIPEENFVDLLKNSRFASLDSHTDLIQHFDSVQFWNPQSIETLIFNNYVGGAGVFWFDGKGIELIRVNEKYTRELGTNLSQKEVLARDAWSYFDEGNKKIYLNTLDKAIESHKEEECEVWIDEPSACCGQSRMCIRSALRLLGRVGDQYLFYTLIRNITSEKLRFQEVYNSEQRFRAASEQANVYAWEYIVQTHEMHPCFRCMRDLGLPAVVQNYPDTAIDMGIFPQDYADMYRGWHRQIDAGAKSLEGIIPLTVGRVPFHVRYTTVFDSAGNPVKAFGSATLVVDKK